MIFSCCDSLRRNALRGGPINGIDFIEVLDRDATTASERQRKLFVHFINPISGPALTKENIRIDGGERIRGIVVTGVTIGSGAEDTVLSVDLDQPGDFSIYTLRIVQDATHAAPPDGYDPILTSIEFSFKVECPSDFDCASDCVCPRESRVEPEINYLAKDYSSFKRLLLDRMSALIPQWKERNAADLGVTLVELLAFVGDSLSYQQDAVGTEAYLGTARRRISVRRHARLVDYLMHEGCNARTWVQVQVSSDTGPLAKGTPLLTRIPGLSVRLPNHSALVRRAQVGFETMHDVPMLFAEQNEIRFYTWADQRCCLPQGATHATFQGHLDTLTPGSVLVFEELLGPITGQAEDADSTHRHPVRLTQVFTFDAHGNPRTDPLNGDLITDVDWADEDVLPFSLCISARTDAEHGERFIENISVARGNIVLADHGLTESDAPIPDTVPAATIFTTSSAGCNHCDEHDPIPLPPRFRPQLEAKPLTHAAPFDDTAPAVAAMKWNVHDALPCIALQSQLNSDIATWMPKRDLLNSSPDATEFVAEIESDGTVYLRFGDDQLGKRPPSETLFEATYRVGNGTAGNIGAGVLEHIVTALTEITSVRNLFPAQGGVDAESVEDVRQRAPAAFRIQERAVTEADYAEMTERDARVQRAAATFRWTGSWHTVFLTADRLGGLAVDEPFKTDIRAEIERYRMAGQDLEVNGPRFVPLEIEMHVCVEADYFRSDIKAALLEVFSNRVLPDGRRGIFHPDNFTLGQTVHLSPLYAAAQAVTGVASAEIGVFQRLGTPDSQPLANGRLTLGRLEIAQLDNDPNFAERGVFRLTLGGGK